MSWLALMNEQNTYIFLYIEDRDELLLIVLEDLKDLFIRELLLLLTLRQNARVREWKGRLE